MSLRPEISGIDLATLTGLFGCPDPATRDRAVAAINEHFANTGDGPTTDHDEAVRRCALAVVAGEVRPGSVDVEDEALIDAVILLSGFDQDPVETTSNYWKSAFLDWFDELPEEPPGTGDRDAWADARQLASWAVIQRPFFGAEQGGEWTTYGYLTNAEAQRLLAYTDRFPRLTEGGHDWGVALVGYLREVVDAGRDYWFYCA